MVPGPAAGAGPLRAGDWPSFTAISVPASAITTATLPPASRTLAGRHHVLLAVTRSLAAVAPAVPLFARGTSAVARLAEMRADDVAARRAGGGQGRRTLLTALLAMAAGLAAVQAPTARLPDAGGVVAARVRRLVDPPPPARWLCHGLALAALTLTIAAVAALVPVFAVTGI
jgi:hypothetical protein